MILQQLLKLALRLLDFLVEVAVFLRGFGNVLHILLGGHELLGHEVVHLSRVVLVLVLLLHSLHHKCLQILLLLSWKILRILK